MKKQHKIMRMLISVLLVMLMLNSGILTGVLAYAASSNIYYIDDEIYNAVPDDPDAPSLQYTLEEYVIAEMQKCKSSIDISSFYVSTSQADAIASLVYDNTPELFHVTRLGYTTFSGYLLTLNPQYSCTAEEYAEMFAGCVARADQLLSGIKDNASLSDVQKALLLHDRIALLCDYDYDNYLNDSIPKSSYNMYGTLVNKFAVCQGYSETYLYLLRQVGIESYLCESDKLNHVWNILIIDGEEYHVDITWDDPVYDITGRVRHVNFLRSSEGIYETGHDSEDYITTPTSTVYDDYFWQNSTTAFQLVGDEIYYIDEKDSNIKKYSDHSAVQSVSDKWMASATSWHSGCYARLSSNGTYLYYNSSQSVFEFDPATGTATQIWTPETEEAYFSIYGFKYEDNYLYCDLYSSHSFKSETKPVYQQKKYYRSAADSADLVGIELDMESIQTEYDLGEAFNFEGFSILLIYDDNTEVVVTDGFTIYCGDNSSEGQKTVTVVYRSLDKTYTTSYAITVACQHKAIIDVPAAASTCTVQGNTAYSKCNICKRIISGSDELLPFAKHDYISSVISALTCTTDGITVYTCSACSDSYTETITASGHAYTTALTAPTCTEQGYTTYTCECGDTYVADYVDATGHSHVGTVTTPATHTATGVMTYTCTCGDSYTEEIAKTTEHSHEAAVTAPTCTEQGYTTYTCECGDTYVADYVDATGHSHVGTVTTPATHTATGVMTYTCTCGDSYTEEIAKTTEHSHEAAVTAPTCTEQGYTTYTCECGDTYVADYVDATGHNHVATVTTPATHTATGVMTYTCTCGDSYTEEIAKTAEHSHEAAVTAPTCTEQGYTTYTCACGDTYVADYVDATGHSHVGTVTTPATHTATGVMTYTCSACGDTYTEVIAKIKHTYTSEVIEEAQCEKDGQKLFACECGHSYTEKIPALGHTDADRNSECDRCGTTVCDHICHQSGILGFFWKIMQFFWKLFGMNPVCECGKAHY